MIDETTVNELSNVFLALSDRTRLRLIGAMSSGEASVNFLAESVGVSQPKVSRHLAYLRAMNVVTTRRVGKNIYYAIDTRPESGAGVVLEAAMRALTGEGAATNMPPHHDFQKAPAAPAEDELAIYLL